MCGQVSMMMTPLPSSLFPDYIYFKNVDLRSLSQYGVCFLATLFMQYVILRVALHEVLIVIALGYVEANVKSFGKKLSENNFKIIISKRFQMKKKFKKKKIKNLISFQNKKYLKKIQPNKKNEKYFKKNI